jgi:hypothetical protein
MQSVRAETSKPDWAKTPSKKSFFDEPQNSTPLKALKEAIKLATPSPLKYGPIFRSLGTTPRKNESSFQTSPGKNKMLEVIMFKPYSYM